MSEIFLGKTDKALMKFCPRCLSPRIQEGPSIGFGEVLPVDCLACSWRGMTIELVVREIEHESGNSNSAVLEAIAKDLRVAMSKGWSVEFGKFLVRWGFISGEVTSAELVRYLTASARASLRAIVEERELIEREADDARARRR